MRVKNVVLWVEQVQLVEQVVEVGAKFNFRVLADDLHGRKTERLAERRVDVEVSRSREYVAVNSRNGWNWA